MPRVIDNIDQHLLPILRDTLAVSERADFCVGYFNLRGWRTNDDLVAGWQPDAGQKCRVLIGMQRPPHEEVRKLYQAVGDDALMDNARASEIKHKFAAHLREQITFGVPTAADEKGLQRLAIQLREGKVQVKLFLPYPLHAKLYLLFRKDINNPITGFVDEHEFDQRNTQGDLFKPGYRKLLEEKNRDLDIYRHSAGLLGKDVNLYYLRDNIDAGMHYAEGILNELLRDQFEAQGVKYEEATWDEVKQDLGKPKKRRIATADIAAQSPMHWGYVFDKVMHDNGGFDIVLTNPPWEIFKPQAKEFFADHSGLVSKNKMTIKEFEKEQGKLLKNKAIRAAWLAYESRFPHLSAWFRASPEYRFQSAVVNGKKTGSDINLYKLFTERVHALLRPGGYCGIVIPSGIYTDLGARGLRDMLFEHTHVQGLFCFENRKTIFENVDSRFKFVVLTFEKLPHPNPLPEGEGVRYGATEPLERARLRAELDGLIAHLYGLTEAKFAHILTTFPLVPDPVKLAARNAFRDVERGLVK